MLDKTVVLDEAEKNIRRRAVKLAEKNVDEALIDDKNHGVVQLTLSEALVVGLLKQGVRRYFAIFGHGSTDLGEILRIYHEEGTIEVINCRNEVEMAHAAWSAACVHRCAKIRSHRGPRFFRRGSRYRDRGL